MQKRRDKRNYIKKVEYAFFHERDIRLAVEDARGTYYVPEIRNASGLADPTASAVLHALTPIRSVKIDGTDFFRPESWLEVIDKTYNWCKRQKNLYYELAKSRYKGEYFARVCVKYNVSITRFYEIIEKVRMYAAIQAAQLNLITVD